MPTSYARDRAAQVSCSPVQYAPGEKRTLLIDMTLGLSVGEIVTAVGAFATDQPGGLAFTNATINAAALSNDKGGTVAIGQGPSALVDAASAVDGQTHTVTTLLTTTRPGFGQAQTVKAVVAVLIRAR